MRYAAGIILKRRANVRLTGFENLPATCPAMIAARHFHQLLDGCVMLACVPRPGSILVAVDWAKPGWQRSQLERACRLANRPVVIRSPADSPGNGQLDIQRFGYLRAAMKQAHEILSGGGILVVFPEGFPNVDPHGSTKPNPDDYLPFRSGFLDIVRAVERRIDAPVPVLPLGFEYQADSDHWLINARLGAPLFLKDFNDVEHIGSEIERLVQDMSAENTNLPASVPLMAQRTK